MAAQGMKSLRRQEVGTAYLLLAPDVIGLLIIYIGPMLYTLYLSFYKWNGSGAKTYVGWDNFAYLFRDPVWIKSVGVTLQYVAMYIPLIVGGALMLALLVNNRLRENKLYRTIFFLPIVVPIIVASVIWQFIYEPSYGLLNFAIKSLGGEPQRWLGSSEQALFAVVLVSAWKQIGYYMILYLAGLKNIPADYYEAATIDGAGAFSKFRHITLPMLKPMLVFVLVVNMIAALQDFDQVYVLTRGGPNYATYVQVFYIYEQAFKYMKMGIASAASVVLFGAILIVSLAQLRATNGGKYE